MIRLSVIIFSLAFTVGCSKEKVSSTPTNPQDTTAVVSLGASENFENGSKDSYASGNVQFETGMWTLNDALVGTSSLDYKFDRKAIRITGDGSLSSDFYFENGVGRVKIYHAAYGSDAPSNWGLFYSTQLDTTWVEVGEQVSSIDHKLDSTIFYVNQAGAVKLQIRKLSGGENRIDIDDITYSDYAPEIPSPGAFEKFEGAIKDGYDNGGVSFPSGSWQLNDAVVGSTPQDRKFDHSAIRIRNQGSLTTNFDLPNGVGEVTLYHGVYGNGCSTNWQLYFSIDEGNSWYPAGDAVVSSTYSLQKSVFAVNMVGNVRLQIRKLTSDSNQINIDDLSFTTYAVENGPSDATRDDNMTMGNPSNATASIDDYTNYYMAKAEYSLSYNRDKGTPNWVSWHLSRAWYGSVPRPTYFNTDVTLPAGWYRVSTNDYTNTGFDRGHLCPASDRDSTLEEEKNTFIMTNIMPQAPYNNQQTWKFLEMYCRTLTDAGNELYIIAGPNGSGGTGSNGGVTTTIANGLVTVPAYTWKVILVLPNGTNDVARVNVNTRVIAVWIPNVQSGLTTDWSIYRTSVDYIESQTGYDFFSSIPKAIQAVIEARTDNEPTK